MDFEAIIASVSYMPAESLRKLKDIAFPIHLPKGHLLFQSNKLKRDIYFLSNGIARVYYYHKSTDVTLCFCTEGDALISLKSYIANEPGYENIELLEPCELYHLKAEKLLSLYAQDGYVANWGRKLAEHELLKTEKRFMAMQFKTASERYAELMADHPQLLLRVQLGYIASYLGVNQVTLSRIRGEKK